MYGLEELNRTKRPGLNALFKEAAIKKGAIGTYVVGFIITPRLNAMGRLEHAIDSLRLLCTTNDKRAKSLARKLGRTNIERQQVADEVVLHARGLVSGKKWPGVIVISHPSYHEGVIGLAASRLVEEFYRPVIVISEGKEESKASARSIPGFSIIDVIREFDDMLLSGGGHPMAAGFSIETKSVSDFAKKMGKLSNSLLTKEVMQRVLKVDMVIEFDTVSKAFYDALQKFEPTGVGNPSPSFVTKDVTVVETKAVGKQNNHLKLKVVKDDIYFNAIAFNLGNLAQSLKPGSKVDISYNVNENVWGGRSSVELKIKDIKIG
jgi:single-stranded-DNA-specific exonuclease